jgi:dTDP-4-amino-4,6-dideoxygalactose transaminase/dienelactone hydrolase
MQITRIRQGAAARPAAARPAAAGPAGLRALVGRLTAVEPVTVSVTGRAPMVVTGLAAERYLLSHSRRERLPATLVAPPMPGPHPAVLVCAGRNATLDQVTGAEPPDHPDRNVAEQLAQAGFVTLTLDYGLAPDLAPGRDPAAVLHELLALEGRCLLTALAEDALGALAWLCDRPEVDPDRVGLFGHSLGAAVALHTALLAERPLPVCAASHLGSYGTLYGRLRTGPVGGAVPGILRHADLPDLYAALAPAPLQVQYGLEDALLDQGDAAAAATAVLAGYGAAEAKEHVEVLGLPMGHGTDVPQAAAFLHRALATPPAGKLAVPAGRVRFDLGTRLEVLDRIDIALASGSLTLGPLGRELEELSAPWTGLPTAAVSSGSSALEMALRVIGVAGRTVLVPANTFFATAASAVRAGAHVDVVDTEPDGLGLDPGALHRRLCQGDDVGAVIAVHIAGVVSPAVHEVLSLCGQRGIDVVEDAAHALGSGLDGRPAGSFGRLGAFSLYPTKVATSGEGGLLSCARPEDLDLVHGYRDQGKASFEANVHTLLGSNWRLSELHAALGAAQLRRLPHLLAARRELGVWYDEHLAGLPGLRPYQPPAGTISNYYKYVVLLDEAVDRDTLRERLGRRHRVALAGGVYDTVVPDQPYFGDAFAGRPFPNARWFAARHVCLPLYVGMPRAHQEAVVGALRAELA